MKSETLICTEIQYPCGIVIYFPLWDWLDCVKFVALRWPWLVQEQFRPKLIQQLLPI